MSDIAIRVENLGKQYRIGKQERYRTLRDSLTDAARAPFRRLRRVPNGNGEPDSIWALKDVSFEVPRGEVVGVIGRNGAGKSTLLKVLSRITEPTEGKAQLRGRVGSLLEVGTGFHPELTGRENVYLNGAILGMKKAEITRRFDEIVAFAEIEKFLDTPVKHYSSGMYMRLAFAVAAHLEPEILIVDEVLAVGDAAFQKKCLTKMGSVADQGRTVLFVSHNLVAVENLCTRALLFENGELMGCGRTRQIVHEYLSRNTAITTNALLSPIRERRGSGEIRFVTAEVISLAVGTPAPVRAGQSFTIRLGFRCDKAVRRPAFSIAVCSSMGLPIFAVHTTDLNVEISEITQGGYVELHVIKPNLLPGRYLLHFAAGTEIDPHRYDHLTDALQLDIEPSDVYGTGKMRSADWSLVFFDCNWRIEADALSEYREYAQDDQQAAVTAS